MQIGALGTILYASLVDLLCFLQPFLKTEGDVLAVAETVSAPFAGCLHFVARLTLALLVPFLPRHMGSSGPSSPHQAWPWPLASWKPKFYPVAWMRYILLPGTRSNADSSPPLHSQLEVPVKYKYQLGKVGRFVCSVSELQLARTQLGNAQRQGSCWFC